MFRPKKVAMLIETSQERGRGLIRGIIHYSRLFGSWDFYITPNDVVQVLPSRGQWEGDGIIARVKTKKLAADIIARGLPTILLSHRDDQVFTPSEMRHYPNICMANDRFGAMAADYCLSKGFKQFAFFCRLLPASWSQERKTGFFRVLRENGIDDFHLFPGPDEKTVSKDSTVIRWLHALPKPIAILASNDLQAMGLMELCAMAGVSVPEDIAVLGIDNDELLCESASPPLSSISCATEQAGFQAAALLDKMMEQHEKNDFVAKTVLIEPIMVVERRSTETDYFPDPLVGAAFDFIKRNVQNAINVGDVVRHVKKSRKNLEIRFKTVTGETLHDAILRLKLQQVKRFLLESNMSLAQIAVSCGFSNVSYMGSVFKKANGSSPDQWRKQYRSDYQENTEFVFQNASQSRNSKK
ncbi:MAG: DNA-binding transcriptional regulator [Thermoguttaceae bacterium]|nr:DNA-binding transcriptional regulator [Thermoguttaceae bacterium]